MANIVGVPERRGTEDRHDYVHASLRHRRLHRFREVVSGLFGLIVVLGGFALTDVPIRRPEDLVGILCYFAPMFLFIVSLWTHVGELLDAHPADDRIAERALTAVLFFATLVPVSLRVGVMPETSSVSPLTFDFFPVSLAIVLLLLAFTSHRLVRRDRRFLHAEDIADLHEHRDHNAITAVLLLASLPIPPGAEILGISLEGIAWVAAFLLPPLVLKVARRLSGPSLHPSPSSPTGEVDAAGVRAVERTELAEGS